MKVKFASIWQNIWKFLIGGIITAVLGAVVIYYLVECLRINPKFSSDIGVAGCYIIGFFIQKYWVFKSEGKVEIKKRVLQFLYFFVTSIPIYALNKIIFRFLYEKYDLHYLAVQGITTLIIFIISFVISKLIFK